MTTWDDRTQTVAASAWHALWNARMILEEFWAWIFRNWKQLFWEFRPWIFHMWEFRPENLHRQVHSCENLASEFSTGRSIAVRMQTLTFLFFQVQMLTDRCKIRSLNSHCINQGLKSQNGKFTSWILSSLCNEKYGNSGLDFRRILLSRTNSK